MLINYDINSSANWLLIFKPYPKRHNDNEHQQIDNMIYEVAPSSIPKFQLVFNEM